MKQKNNLVNQLNHKLSQMNNNIRGKVQNELVVNTLRVLLIIYCAFIIPMLTQDQLSAVNNQVVRFIVVAVIVYVSFIDIPSAILLSIALVLTIHKTGNSPSNNSNNNNSNNNNESGNRLPNECYPKDVLTPQDLLPQDANSTWAQTVPNGQGNLGDQNFLNAGFHVGINTVGQSLRNANLNLRAEPPNPRVQVSPWLNTTIGPDLTRTPLDDTDVCSK